MAKDSSMLKIEDAIEYSRHLKQSAFVLTNEVNSIKRQMAAISQAWEDKQSIQLMELLKKDATEIYNLANELLSFGVKVQKYANENMEAIRELKKNIN